MNQDSNVQHNALYIEFIHLQMQIFKRQGDVENAYQKAQKIWSNIKPRERQSKVELLKNNLNNNELEIDNKKIEDFFHPKNVQSTTSTHLDLNEVFLHSPVIKIGTTNNLVSNFHNQSNVLQERHNQALNKANDIFDDLSIQKNQIILVPRNTQYTDFYKSRFHEIRQQNPDKTPNEITKLISQEWKLYKKDNISSYSNIKQKKMAKDNTKMDLQCSQNIESNIHSDKSPQKVNLESQLSRTNFQIITDSRKVFVLSGNKILELLRKNAKSEIIEVNLQELTQNNYINTHVLNGLQNIEPQFQQPSKEDLNVREEYQGQIKQEVKNSLKQESIEKPSESVNLKRNVGQRKIEADLDIDNSDSQSIDSQCSSQILALINYALKKEIDNSQDSGALESECYILQNLSKKVTSKNQTIRR